MQVPDNFMLPFVASQHNALIKAGLMDKVKETINKYEYWSGEDAEGFCFAVLHNFVLFGDDGRRNLDVDLGRKHGEEGAGWH